MEKVIIDYLHRNNIFMRTCIDENSGETWYVVADLFRALDYKNASKKVSDICKNPRKYQFDSPGGKQYFICVNFPELMRLILSFRKNKQFDELQDFILYTAMK